MKKLVSAFDATYMKQIAGKGITASLGARLRRFVAGATTYEQTEHIAQRLRRDLGMRWLAMGLGTVWWLPPGNR